MYLLHYYEQTFKSWNEIYIYINIINIGIIFYNYLMKRNDHMLSFFDTILDCPMVLKH